MAAVFQVFLYICLAGMDPDTCTNAVPVIQGPICPHDAGDCYVPAFEWFHTMRDGGDPRVADMTGKYPLYKYPKIGTGTPPPIDYGKVSEPEYRKLD